MLARLVNKVTFDSQFLSPSSSNLSEVIIELTASDSPATERNPEFIVPLLTGRDHPGEPSKNWLCNVYEHQARKCYSLRHGAGKGL